MDPPADQLEWTPSPFVSVAGENRTFDRETARTAEDPGRSRCKRRTQNRRPGEHRGAPDAFRRGFTRRRLMAASRARGAAV